MRSFGKILCRTAAGILSLTLLGGMLLPALPTLSFASEKEEESKVESRKTPIMGWSSWNAYRSEISEGAILSQAKKLRELGLADLGYVFVNVDDGWQNGRGSDGYVNINTERFPSGMKSLADTIHSMGFKVGIYTDAGELTCGSISDGDNNNGNVGLYGHDETDLERYFVEWGYDFIKVDWCGGQRLGLSQKDRYTAIGRVVADIEKRTGKDKIYNVCCWSFPGEWVLDVADSWRTGGDINNTFESILYQIDNIKSLAKYNGPGHVNDLDMLQVGNGMTYEEDKSHFAMWCMMSTPLMLGMDLNSISNETLSIVSNMELIDIDQDPACIQATVAANYGSVEAWTKDLGKADAGKKAIALLNRSNQKTTVTISFRELGLADVGAVRDLWAHENISTGDSFTVTIPAHGTMVYTAEGTPVPIKGTQLPDILTEDGSTPVAEMNIEAKPSSIDLTKLGKYDWVHYASTPTRMKDGSGEISLYYDGRYVSYDNAAARYSWTNGDQTTARGSSSHGIGVVNLGAFMVVSTPCDKNVRTLSVSVGSYSADMRIEMIIGGKVLAFEEIKGGGGRKEDRLVTMTYSSDIPTTAYLKWTVTANLGNDDSVNVEGVALSMVAKDDTLKAPVLKKDKDGVVKAVVNATATSKGAILHTVMRDSEGKIAFIDSKPLKVGEEPIREEIIPEVPSGFVGKIEVYLWNENNLPLTKMQETEVNISSVSDYHIGPMTASSLVSKGAILLDVRSPEEYAAGHIENAVNLEYSKVASEIENLISDKAQPIIVYCSAAKRSAQALDALLKLGYSAVYNLGSMDNYTSRPLITFTASTCKVITAGDKIDVSFTASPYDSPSVLISVGKDSTLSDALPLKSFKVPDSKHYYLTLKAYLVQDGVCYAETNERFIYWSESTVDVFAAELNWISATIGWGEIHKNQSVDGNRLTLAGKTFTHGIGTHATSDIVMNIPSGAQKFLAVAGCDLEKSGGESMMFYVYIDGVQVDASSLIKIGQHYVFDIDIPEGAKQIRLYVFEGHYDGNTNDHADWTVAGFFNNPTEG